MARHLQWHLLVDAGGVMVVLGVDVMTTAGRNVKLASRVEVGHVTTDLVVAYVRHHCCVYAV